MSEGSALRLLEERGAGLGSRLAEARRRSGQSLEEVAAATRIRRPHLAAIERDDLDALPGPVYARGYVRAYADHLGLEVADLLPAAAAAPPVAVARRYLSLGRVAPRQLPAHLTLTRPAVAAAALAVTALLFAGYAWREMETARTDAGAAPTAAPAAAAPPIASLPPLPSAVPTTTATPAPRPVVVAVKAAEPSWLTVTIDGKQSFAGLLAAGDERTFTGRSVRLSAGKPSLLVSTDGGDFKPLGVLKKEYSAET